MRSKPAFLYVNPLLAESNLRARSNAQQVVSSAPADAQPPDIPPSGPAASVQPSRGTSPGPSRSRARGAHPPPAPEYEYHWEGRARDVADTGEYATNFNSSSSSRQGTTSGSSGGLVMAATRSTSQQRSEHTELDVDHSTAEQMQEGGPSSIGGGVDRPPPPQETCGETSASACVGGYAPQPVMSVGGDGQSCDEPQKYISEGQMPAVPGSAVLKDDSHDSSPGNFSANTHQGQASQGHQRRRYDGVCCCDRCCRLGSDT